MRQFYCVNVHAFQLAKSCMWCLLNCIRYVHHYNAQTDQWVLLEADGVLRHSVGVSFTPEADLRVVSQHESDDLDSDGIIDYRLQLIECTTLEPSSTLRGPACASYANTTEDFQDADSDG